MKTDQTHHATLLPALLLIGAIVFTASSVAANPCTTADGFLDTGIGIMDPANDSPPRKGIGGTGRDGDEEDNGIGGTGAVGHNNGIGGTGQTAELIYVTGTIHAFGSVCVNGVEIEYTENTPVSTDTNQTIKTSSLKVGQVVDIIAEKKTGMGMPRAKNIAVRFPLQGAVTKISRDKQVIDVMGKPVQLNDPKAGESIRLGDRIRVSGLQSTQGRMIASFIERMPKQASAGTSPSNTRVIPSSITHFSVQGYVQRRTPEGTVVIEGQSFDLGVSGKEIKVGTRMIVSGRRQPNGTIRASRWVREQAAIGARVQFDHSGKSRHRNRGRGGDRDEDREDNSGPGRSKRSDDKDRIDNSGRGSGKSDRDRPDNSGRGKQDRPDRVDRLDNSGSGRSDRPERVERSDNSGRRDRPERIDRLDNSGSGRSDRPERPDRSGRGGGGD